MLRKRVGDQNLLNRLGHFSLGLLICFSTLSAEESFKDFKKSQSDYFKKYKDGIADLGMTPEEFSRDFSTAIKIKPAEVRGWE